MSGSRFDKLPSDRRQAILTAAGEEFAAHGFKGASLNRIIAAAGISKGKFYYYFTDKADLFERVFQRVEELFVNGLAPASVLEAMRVGTFWDDLAGLIAAKMVLVEETPWVVGLGKALYTLPAGTFSPEVIQRLKGQAEWLQQCLARGQELGAVRTDLPAGGLASICFAAGEAYDLHLFATATPEELLADMERLTNVGLDLMRRITTADVSQLKELQP